MTSMDVQQHLQEAMRARQSGREDEANRHFEAILAIDPNEPMARNALGNAALNAGDPASAADHFAVAARSDPKAPPLWINLAKAKRLLNDDAGEREALEQALSIDQTHLMAHIRLAELHERRGEVAEATEHWNGVAASANGYPNPPDELRRVFDHAREYVARLQSVFADRLDRELADNIQQASERDRRRMKAAAERMTGRRKIYHNICHGLHYPFLPEDEFFDRGHFPWFAELEAATDMIREELQAILAMPDPGLSPYVTMPEGTPENLWSKLDHSTDWSSLHLWREGERIDEACAKAPKTAEFIARLPRAEIPNRAPTAFFSILKAGKHIPPHTGVTNTRAIIHLPLIVPPGCEFRVGGEIRPWVEGEAFAFDDTIEHEAWNRSDQDRAVLILDAWNPHLSKAEQTMIAQMFEIADDVRKV